MNSTQDKSLSGAATCAPEDVSADGLARELRDRAQNALSASVHHALLSQQSLLMAQRFWALTDAMSSQPPDIIRRTLQMLDREQATGQAAAPFLPASGQLDHWRVYHGTGSGDGSGLMSDGSSFPTSQGLVLHEPVSQQPVSNWAAESVHRTMSSGRDDIGESATNAASVTTDLSDEAEPNHQNLQDGANSSDVQAADGRTTSEKNTPDEELTSDQLKKEPAKVTKGKRKKPNRRIRRAREFAERVRLMAPMLLERIRIRTRKGDLKPKLRTTTEELKKTRSPAAISSISLGVILFLMALTQLELTADSEPELISIISGFSADPKPVPESLPVEPPAEEVGEQMEEPPEEVPEPTEEVEEAVAEDSAEEETPPDADQPVTSESVVGKEPSTVEKPRKPGSTSGRHGAAKKQLLEKYGGSPASESSVHLALEWLASRQRRDGTWDFTDVGDSGNPGTISNPIGATAYALLPFLGAGQTHRDRTSPYRQNIESGLASLLRMGIPVPAGLDLRGIVNKGSRDPEPNEAYYVHGAATLVLCEASAMTKDRRLRAAAEEAVRFLVNSQDPQGGGWRYLPHQPGSTSATAVQLLALASAKKAGIRVPEAAFRGVSFYLDSVQIDQAGRYGYEREKKAYQISVTAMALLSRMYLGWDRDDGDLRAGVKLLDERGPYENLYYSYFATQVMRNWGGQEWHRWNERLRDDLVAWQEKDGSRRGSWAPRDRSDSSRAGGRLLTTCLAALTLEVYYRYEPLLEDPDEDSQEQTVAETTDGSGDGDTERGLQEQSEKTEEAK
jgi:hypothetical protein